MFELDFGVRNRIFHIFEGIKFFLTSLSEPTENPNLTFEDFA